MARRFKNMIYGISDNLLDMPPLPIVSQRAPTTRDRVEIGTIWIDQPNDDTYILTSITANAATWINAGGGTGTFNALTVTTTATVGTTLLVGGVVTLSNLGVGVVQSGATGILTSSGGTNGQILCGSTGLAPAWTSITSGTLVITPGAGTLNIEESGGTANSFVTDVAGPIAPLLGVTTIAGGLNITTDGSVANTITFNLDNNVVLAGGLTAGVNLTMQTGICTITADADAAQAIYLHANGGTNETVEIHSDQGTGAASIYIHSDVGGIDLTSGLSTADAINITCSDAAGGIDIDSGTSGTIIDSTGAISLDGAGASNFSVAGAGIDLTLASAAGSVAMTAGEAIATAIVIDATNAAGGIDIDAGTGGISVVTANGVIAFESGTAAINVGADAVAHTVTVGSVTGAASTVIQSGTGDLIMTSTDDITIDCAGVLELNSTAGIIGIGSDADNFAINIGTAGVRTVTIGSVTAGTAVAINAESGNIALTTAGAGDINIDSDDTLTIDADGVLEINSSAGVIGIGNDADAQDINLGTGAAQRVITIGNGTAATQVVVDSGTAGVNIGTNAIAQTVTLGNTTGASAVAINSGTGDITLTGTVGRIILESTDNVADAIYLHTDSGITEQIRLHADQGTAAASILLQSDVGGVTLNGGIAAAGALTLVASDAAGGIDIDYGTGGMTIDATNGAFTLQTGTGAIGLGTDAVAKTVTIGNATGASSVVVDCGTGACSFGASATAHVTTVGSVNTTSQTIIQSGTGDVNITSTDAVTIDATGVIELNSTGADITIGGDADAHDVYISTGAAAKTLTLGSTNTTSATTIQAGTGSISIEPTAGNVAMTPATNTVAGVALTLDARFGQVSYTGQVTGSGASVTLTLTNNFIAVNNAFMATVTNGGANDAQMSVQRIEQKAGSAEIILKNNGAAALNGTIYVTFWVLN